MSDYDVWSVRGLYGSLSDDWTFLNAHARPQIPERVSAAVARAFRRAPIPAGRSSLEADHLVQDARGAVADLVGASAERVILGSSLTVLYQGLLGAMAPILRHDPSVVLCRADRPELSHTLERAARDVRWAQPDLATGELPAFQFHELVDRSTRLVSVPAAHHLLGTVTPVREIVDVAHRHARLWVLVDASAYAPYRVVNVEEWDADIVAVDLAALGGPEVAALVFRDERMLGRLDLSAFPGAVSPGLAGGVPAVVEHYASLTDVAGSLRDRLVASGDSMAGYLKDMGRDLEFFIGSLPSVHILGVSGEAAFGTAVPRTPRISFGVRGVPAKTVFDRLLDNGLYCTLTPTDPLLDDMGAAELGGTVTVSLSPFNTGQDIDHLTRVVASLA